MRPNNKISSQPNCSLESSCREITDYADNRPIPRFLRTINESDPGLITPNYHAHEKKVVVQKLSPMKEAGEF